MNGKFAQPGSTEMYLRSEIRALRERVRILESDTSGASLIKAQSMRIAKLEADQGKLAKIQIDYTNLRDVHSRLEIKQAQIKKDNSRLKADLSYCHAYERGLRKELALTEKLRYQWAQRARRAEGDAASFRKAASKLARRCISLGSRVKKRNEQILEFSIKIESMETKIRELCAERDHLRVVVNRNDSNSSISPAMSPNSKRNICNLREKTGRKRGGQLGHIGHRRALRTPDAVVDIEVPCTCPHCGTIPTTTGDDIKVRQITDVRLIAVTTEYRAHATTCTECGRILRGTFPKHVQNEANYSPATKALCVYLVNRLNMSIDNAISFIWEGTAHAVKISKGSFSNFLREFARAAEGEGIMDAIERAIATGHHIGSDATFTKTSGKQTYVYTFTNDNATLYTASKVKGKEPLEGSLVSTCGQPIVHDHDKNYYAVAPPDTKHVECNVHILRYLKAVMENEPEKKWAHYMANLLREANRQAKQARARGETTIEEQVAARIERKYDLVLALAEKEYARDPRLKTKYKPEGLALFKRLREYKAEHLAFMRDLNLPFDNSASERALRRVKMKTKQSGGFRSHENGAKPYCAVLSVTQTAAQRDIEILKAVESVFTGSVDWLVVAS